jgi:hypothetical protein
MLQNLAAVAANYGAGIWVFVLAYFVRRVRMRHRMVVGCRR